MPLAPFSSLVRSRSGSGPRFVRRGQAIIELAMTLPIVIILLFGTVSFWSTFQRIEVQSDAATAVVELLARRGDYDEATRDAARQQIDDAIGVDAAETYLYIHALLPNGSELELGTPTPANTAGAPNPPANTGWDSVTVMQDLPRGSRVRVDVWSYGRVIIPLLPLDSWHVMIGHSVMEVISE